MELIAYVNVKSLHHLDFNLGFGIVVCGLAGHVDVDVDRNSGEELHRGHRLGLAGELQLDLVTSTQRRHEHFKSGQTIQILGVER